MCIHISNEKYHFHFRKTLHTKIGKERKNNNNKDTTKWRTKKKKKRKTLHQVFVLQQEQKLLITNTSDKTSVVLGSYTRVGNS